MRWDGLFADLEAQAQALRTAERAAEVDDRSRMLVGATRLADRLRPAIGSSLRVRCAGGHRVSATLTRVGADWLLLAEPGGRESVIAASGVLGVTGASRLSATGGGESVVESRLGLGHALRGIARDRAHVRLLLADGDSVDGTLDRVGRDYLEVAVHPGGEARRWETVREVQLLTFAAVVVIQRCP